MLLAVSDRHLHSNFVRTPKAVVETGTALIDDRNFLVTGDYYKRDGH